LKAREDQNWTGIVGGAIAAILLLVALNAFVIINPGEAGVISILGKARDGALLEADFSR